MAGLYVHIPFCRSKCAYCDFYSGPLRGFSPQAYADALTRELRARTIAPRYDTVYIGGGTPSTMPPELLAPFYALSDGESTIEVNPEDLTPQAAEAWLRAGANRVSMGVQSLIDSELAAVGRRHSADQALRAFRALRDAGFANISLDLIYGLPGQTTQSWRQSLEGLLNLEPEHLSAYCLSYEPGTLLHTRLTAGKIQETPEDDIVQMYDDLCRMARQAGFQHYEIANFALPGRHSRHNSAYWDDTPYLGLGPGAHSFSGSVRTFNPPNLQKYMQNPAQAHQEDPETDTDRHNDTVMTALRTARGLDPAILTAKEKAYCQTHLQQTPAGTFRIPEPSWLLTTPLTLPLLR